MQTVFVVTESLEGIPGQRFIGVFSTMDSARLFEEQYLKAKYDMIEAGKTKKPACTYWTGIMAYDLGWHTVFVVPGKDGAKDCMVISQVAMERRKEVGL